MNCDKCGKEFKLIDWKYPFKGFTLCNNCRVPAKIPS